MSTSLAAEIPWPPSVGDFFLPPLVEGADPQLLEVIKNGRGMMPGFAQQLNDQGLQALVGHVRGFSPR